MQGWTKGGNPTIKLSRRYEGNAVRTVLLTAHTPEGEVQHRHVAHSLLEAFGDDLVAIIVATGMRRSVADRLRRWWKRYSINEITSRLVARLMRRYGGRDTRRQRALQRILFPHGDDGRMPGGSRVVRITSHNSSECRALLAHYDADVVIVYGTLIIGPRTIEACRRPINLHTGWSPHYRGSDTIFWALHNGEINYAGVTVHQLTQGVDAGAILARGRPQIDSTDDEATLFAKGVKLGAQLLASCARREAAGSVHPLEQDLASGHEYRSVDRTIAAERRLDRRMRAGLLRQGGEEWLEEF